MAASNSPLNCMARVAVFGTALALLATTARPALVVNTVLGTLGAGSVNLTGTTVAGPNNANNYSNSSTVRFWGSEYVYKFTISVRAVISITSDDPNGGIDNDFFLLSGLATTPNGVLNIGSAVGELVEVEGTFGVFDPGTYFLSIDSFASDNSALPGNAGPFNAVLTVAPPVAPPSMSAVTGGSITTTLVAGEVLWFMFNHPGGAITLDTAASTLAPSNDTELFLFSSNGDLAAENDDIDFDELLSRISQPTLAAGTYYLAVSGYDATGVPGFDVSSASEEAGQLVLSGLTLAPEPVKPLLAAVSLVGNTQTLRLSGTVGKTFLIEKTPSLAPASWEQDGAPVTLTTAEQTITRTVGAGETRLFLRAREP